MENTRLKTLVPVFEGCLKLNLLKVKLFKTPFFSIFSAHFQKVEKIKAKIPFWTLQFGVIVNLVLTFW